MAGNFDWARADAWRQHPLLRGQLKHAFPGFGIGVGLFAVYALATSLPLAGSAKKAEGAKEAAHH